MSADDRRIKPRGPPPDSRTNGCAGRSPRFSDEHDVRHAVVIEIQFTLVEHAVVAGVFAKIQHAVLVGILAGSRMSLLIKTSSSSCASPATPS